MGIDYERQELRALVLMPIRHLPDYADDSMVNCRVGKVVAAHAALTPWDRGMQLTLEKSLNERYPALPQDSSTLLLAKSPVDHLFDEQTTISHWYRYKADQSKKRAKLAVDSAHRSVHKEDEKAWLEIAKDHIRNGAARAAKLLK